MKRTALTVHEKAVNRVQRQADRALDKFRKTELDVQEANADLHDVVTAIDIEMDKLAALRIKTQKQISANDAVLTNIGALLGKGN
jgi:hypothetical protein